MSFFKDHCTRIAEGREWGIADGKPTAVFGDSAAATGAFLSRTLTAVKSKSMDVKYPNLKAKSLFPVSHEYPAGVQTIVVPSFDGAAIVKQINDYATDLPKAEIKATETTQRNYNYGNAYSYTNQEIRRAQMAGGIPLQARKATVSHRAHEEKINQIAFFGDGNDLKGLFNYPGLPRSSAAATFENSTPDEVLAIMNTAITTIVDTTNQVESPNKLILPVKQYRHIATTARSAQSDKTILEYFLDNNPNIDVEAVNEMKGAGTAGVDVMVAYEVNPDQVQLQIPLEPQHTPPQPTLLAMEVAIESECAGLSIYYPLSFNIIEGI